jgi:Mg/Co/Ni transporter MgtE
VYAPIDVRDDIDITGAELLDAIRAAIKARDADQARLLAGRMLDEDALELLEDLNGRELTHLFAFLGEESLGALLARLDHRDAAGILTRMSATQAADILEVIGPDDATDIVQVINANDPESVENILVAMEPEEAAEIRELLPYGEDTAGGLMTPEFVAAFPEVRADETITALRRVATELDNVQYVYVIDFAAPAGAERTEYADRRFDVTRYLERPCRRGPGSGRTHCDRTIASGYPGGG